MPIEIYLAETLSLFGYIAESLYWVGCLCFYLWCVPFVLRRLKMDEAKRKTLETYLVDVPYVGVMLADFVFELIDLGA